MTDFDQPSAVTKQSSDFDINYGDLSNFTLFELKNMTFTDIPGSMRLLHLWIWPIFFWVTFVVGICGNWMVIYVIVKKQEMRTATNLFLFNLAIADILYLVTAIPNTTYWTDYWPCGEFMCKYYLVSASFSHLV